MARQILISSFQKPTAARPLIALKEPVVDVSPASWDTMREILWCYQSSQSTGALNGVSSGNQPTDPWYYGIKEGSVRRVVAGTWRVQSVRFLYTLMGWPVVEVESWGYIDSNAKVWYEASGNYALSSTLNFSKYLGGRFLGGEHWSIQTSFYEGAITIGVPFSTNIPGPVTLQPALLDGPSAIGLFRVETQIIKGNLHMLRKFYAFHGTYWV